MGGGGGGLLGKMMQKNVVENVLPVLVTLKSLLERARSSLQGPLLEYLRVLQSEYPSDFEALFVENRLLALELRGALGGVSAAAARRDLLQHAPCGRGGDAEAGAAAENAPKSPPTATPKRGRSVPPAAAVPPPWEASPEAAGRAARSGGAKRPRGVRRRVDAPTN